MVALKLIVGRIERHFEGDPQRPCLSDKLCREELELCRDLATSPHVDWEIEPNVLHSAGGLERSDVLSKAVEKGDRFGNLLTQASGSCVDDRDGKTRPVVPAAIWSC